MYRPAIEYGASVDIPALRWETCPQREGNRAMMCDHFEGPTLYPKQRGVVGSAETHSTPSQRVEHRLDVRRRTADDTQDLRRRRLLVERLGKITVPRL